MVGVEEELVAMQLVYRWWISHQKHHGPAVFSASSHWGGIKLRFGGGREALDPKPQTIARVESMRDGFHTGATSRLCKVHPLQPGPRALPSRNPSHEPILSLRILCPSPLLSTVDPVGVQACSSALEINPRLPCRKNGVCLVGNPEMMSRGACLGF